VSQPSGKTFLDNSPETYVISTNGEHNHINISGNSINLLVDQILSSVTRMSKNR